MNPVGRRDPGFMREVETLFDAALDLPHDARRAWVVENCGARETLREEVLSLLAVADESARFLDTTRVLVELDELDRFETGERIGPFEVVREIGRGGMGVVLLARRADGQFEQTVALKLLRRGIDTEAVLGSFLRERQILAWLQHPNIARLHDGGITADGRPWIALEYVDGIPITRYCALHAIEPRELIGLHLGVCEAVQYAHRNLVIHRDLKPSNVLVTSDGIVKLLDFGIAKILDDSDPPDRQAGPPGARALTPEYAAPEQLRNEPVSTATDVYALGVLLHELLTGRLPHVHRDPTSSSGNGDTLSSSHPPNGVERHPRLTGDLGAIVSKAIEPEPDARYRTVESLAEDMRRYLAGLSVQARGDALVYRTGKLLRRNLGAVFALCVIMLLLTGATIVSRVQYERAERERARTERVKEFLVGIVESADPLADDVTRALDASVLELALQRIEHELAEQPDLQAELYSVVGRSFIGRGDLEAARIPLERALTLRRELHDSHDLRLADALYAVAGLERKLERYEQARPLYEEALSIHVGRHGYSSLETAAVLNGLGANAYGAGDLDAAEEHYERSLAIKRELLDSDHREIAIGLNNLALLYRQQKKFDLAEMTMRDAIERKSRAFGPDHPTVATSHAGLGTILHRVGRFDEAIEAYGAAARLREARLGADHVDTRLANGNLALALHDAGRDAEACAVLEALVVRAREQSENVDASTLEHLAGLGEVLLTQERIEDAGAAFELLARLAATIEVRPARGTARAHAGLGVIAATGGDLPRAIELLESSVRLHESAESSGSRAALWARAHLGSVLSIAGRHDEALAALVHATGVLIDEFPSSRTRTIAEDLLRAHQRRTGPPGSTGAPD